MLLIDGDIICYRTAFSKEATTLASCVEIADAYIRNILKRADPEIEEYCVFLSGKSNYRKDIAVTKEYKGNRKVDKPEHLDDISAHLLACHPSDLSEGEEADDRIAIKATELGYSSIICSIDKDFDQVPGWHYNFVKHKRYFVEPAEAMLNFYCQILTGDRIDNVEGIYGIGPVKARKLLKELTTEKALFNKCVELYGATDRVIENARLLWLRRYPNQQWQVPEV